MADSSYNSQTGTQDVGSPPTAPGSVAPGAPVNFTTVTGQGNSTTPGAPSGSSQPGAPGASTMPSPPGGPTQPDAPDSSSQPDPPGSPSQPGPPGVSTMLSPPGGSTQPSPPSASTMPSPPGDSTAPSESGNIGSGVYPSAPYHNPISISVAFSDNVQVFNGPLSATVEEAVTNCIQEQPRWDITQFSGSGYKLPSISDYEVSFYTTQFVILSEKDYQLTLQEYLEQYQPDQLPSGIDTTGMVQWTATLKPGSSKGFVGTVNADGSTTLNPSFPNPSTVPSPMS